MYFAEFTDRGRENTEYKGKKEVHPPSPSSPVCTHIHMHGNSPWLPFFKAVAASDTQTPAREVNGMKIAVSRQDYIFSFPAIVCSSRREHRRPPRAAAAPRTPAGDAGTLPGPGEGPQPSAALSPPGPARPGWLQRAPKLREAIPPQPRQTACFAEGGGGEGDCEGGRGQSPAPAAVSRCICAALPGYPESCYETLPLPQDHLASLLSCRRAGGTRERPRHRAGEERRGFTALRDLVHLGSGCTPTTVATNTWAQAAQFHT